MFIYERFRPTGTFFGLAMIIMGIIFIAFPGLIAQFLAAIVGAIIVLYGLFRTITVVNGWPYLPNRFPLLIVGILLFIAGIMLLFNPNLTISIAGTIIGIFAVLTATDRFITANRLKGQINVWPTVISGIIHLVFGLVMIYSAVFVFSVIIVVIGIYLLVAGIMFFLSATYFHDF
ncbi:MAG: DUF308 domain-containing protein [Bacillota bacterium]|nr:DUF308 domain-containing protein [Bacillota bacterium]